MFDMEPGEEFQMIQGVVQRFSADVLAENYRTFEADKALPAEVLSAYSELGLAGLELPEHLGGAALEALAKATILEELGVGDPGAALALDGIGAALYAIAETGGDSALRQYIVPLLGQAPIRAVLIWDDGGQRQRHRHRQGLRRVGNNYDGTESWVPSQHADLMVILDREGVSLVDLPHD